MEEARGDAVAMHGLAEIRGDAMRVRQAQQRTERDIVPLSREVASALQKVGNVAYRAPTDGEHGGAGAGGLEYDDTQRLISQSEELLRESQA